MADVSSLTLKYCVLAESLILRSFHVSGFCTKKCSATVSTERDKTSNNTYFDIKQTDFGEVNFTYTINNTKFTGQIQGIPLKCLHIKVRHIQRSRSYTSTGSYTSWVTDLDETKEEDVEIDMKPRVTDPTSVAEYSYVHYGTNVNEDLYQEQTYVTGQSLVWAGDSVGGSVGGDFDGAMTFSQGDIITIALSCSGGAKMTVGEPLPTYLHNNPITGEVESVMYPYNPIKGTTMPISLNAIDKIPSLSSAEYTFTTNKAWEVSEGYAYLWGVPSTPNSRVWSWGDTVDWGWKIDADYAYLWGENLEPVSKGEVYLKTVNGLIPLMMYYKDENRLVQLTYSIKE